MIANWKLKPITRRTSCSPLVGLSWDGRQFLTATLSQGGSLYTSLTNKLSIFWSLTHKLNFSKHERYCFWVYQKNIVVSVFCCGDTKLSFGGSQSTKCHVSYAMYVRPPIICVSILFYPFSHLYKTESVVWVLICDIWAYLCIVVTPVWAWRNVYMYEDCSSYLLGLLAKIKCSISSSQPDLWDWFHSVPSLISGIFL